MLIDADAILARLRTTTSRLADLDEDNSPLNSQVIADFLLLDDMIVRGDYPVVWDPIENENSSVTSEIDKLEETISDLENDITDLEKDVDALESKLSEIRDLAKGY